MKIMEVEKETEQVGESSKKEGICEKSSDNFGTFFLHFC